MKKLLLLPFIPFLLCSCATQRRGATLPWTTHEAEAGKSNAAVHGPSRQYLTPEAEASGRQYIRLDATGHYVEFTAKHRANALVARYSIPDGADATVSLYINGVFRQKLALTPRYAWVYGNFPWTNEPRDGQPHHFFDEVRALLGQVLPGDKIRLQKDNTDTAGYYLVDFIELEQVAPPRLQPANSLSLSNFSNFAECVRAAQAQRKIVWIPPGEFKVTGITTGDVEIRGAGMWYSTLQASSRVFEGNGKPLKVSDLALFGNVTRRNDSSADNAFNGNFGDGSELTRLWIEHFKCGIWTTRGTKNLRVTGCRIRTTMADGINLCDSTSDSTVRQCHLRNTGDDALATWSPSGDWSSKKPCVRNAFLNNTVQLPWLANGIALYGGTDHRIAGNLITDTVFSGAGILISSGHGAIPFAGNIRVEHNTIVRAGGDCYIGETIGGLWFHAMDSDIDAGISINDMTIVDCRNSGITVHGPRMLSRAALKHVVIDGADHAVQIKPGVKGTLSIADMQSSNLRRTRLQNGSPSQFNPIQ